MKKILSKVSEACVDNQDTRTMEVNGLHFQPSFPAIGSEPDKFKIDAAPRMTGAPFHAKNRRNTYYTRRRQFWNLARLRE